MKLESGAHRGSPSLASNSRWNLIAFAFTLAANFVTIPFVVRWIGLDAFGLAALVLAVCAPMTLIGTVLGQALIREISSREGANESHSAKHCLQAALRLCFGATLACGLLLITAGPSITRSMSSAAAASNLQLAFLMATTGGIAQQAVLVLQGASAARRDYRTIAKVTVFSALASVGTTLGFSWWDPSAVGYLHGVAAGFLLSLAAWLSTLRAEIAWRDLFWTHRRTETAALLHFGKWQGIAQLAGAFGNQIDRYALGALAPIAVVGQYTVANRLQEAAYIGVVKAGEVLFPHFGSMSNADIQQRQRFFQTSSWVMGVFGAAMLAPLALLAHGVLTLWVGADAASGSDRILVVLVIGGMVGSASNVFVYYAMGMGRNAPVAAISVMYSLLTMLMTVFLITLIGPEAAGAGLLFASVVRVAVSLLVTRRLFFPALTWSDLFVSTVLPVLVGTGVVLVGLYIPWIRPDNWFTLLATYAALGAAVLLVNVLAGVATQSGRDILQGVSSPLRGLKE